MNQESQYQKGNNFEVGFIYMNQEGQHQKGNAILKYASSIWTKKGNTNLKSALFFYRSFCWPLAGELH